MTLTSHIAVADPVIVADHLTKVYPGEIRAVDDLCLELTEAKFSGCSARTDRGRRPPQGCSRRVVRPGVERWLPASTSGLIPHAPNG